MARPRVYKLQGSYGEFDGKKLFYTGFAKRPGFLPESRRGFAGLKHLLELLKRKFRKFELTFTPDEDSVRKDGSTNKIRLSAKAIRRFSQRRWDGNRELNLRLGKQLLAEALPTHFSSADPFYSYQRGMFAGVLIDAFDPRTLSVEDRKALTKFVLGRVSEATGSLDIATAYKTTRDAQLVYLERLVAEFDREIARGHDESWWQTYFGKNILYFQDNYIRRIEKMNVMVAGTQFPDFAVVTSDGYLDIIEIKKPGTDLLRLDDARHNYYWSTEIAKAISQVENYIDNVTKHGDTIRNKLKDDHGIELRIIKPRGIVVAGTAESFSGKPKMADDFRRLNEGLKNVQIVPYDELSQHLKNAIESIKRLADASSRVRAKVKRAN
jgi:hypothetical protein